MDGGEIRKKRLAAGLSGVVIARRLSMPPSSFFDIENGRIPQTPEQVERIVAVIDQLGGSVRALHAYARGLGLEPGIGVLKFRL
jgi:transcriptional regulator with XRE-family HTH domain